MPHLKAASDSDLITHTKDGQPIMRQSSALVILPLAHFKRDNRESQEGNRRDTFVKHTVRKHTDVYLAVLWCVEDVHSAWFDAVGLGPSVQSKATLSAPTVSAWKRAIVPGERHTKTCTG